MSFLPYSREQGMLFGYCLSDFPAVDSKCRFIVELVRQLKLDKLYERYSLQGGHAYDPGVMLSLWFLAYSERVTSSRKLEELCGRDMLYIYLSANQHPDYSTLCRFRKDNLDLMIEYFEQLVAIVVKAGNVSSFSHIAGDGTKVAAFASHRQARNEEDLKERIRQLRRDIANYLKECDQSDEDIFKSEEKPKNSGENNSGQAGNEPGLFGEEDPADESKEVKKDTALIKKQKEVSKLESCLEELIRRRQALKKEYRSGHKIVQTDRDSYLMDVDGRKRPAYNGQTMVDTDVQIIVAFNVVQDRNDQQQFASMYEKCETNLGSNPLRLYTMDAGYHSLDQLAYINEHGIDAVIAEPNPGNRSGILEQSSALEPASIEVGEKIKRNHFRYDAEHDCYWCPEGKSLPYVKSRPCRGRVQRIYTSVSCSVCSLKMFCQPKPDKMRSLYRDEEEYLAEAMYKKSKSELGRQRLKKRRTTVEPVFGNMKENMGFRRFRMRGLEAVRGEFALMCIAHNINKLYRMNFEAFLDRLYQLFIGFYSSLGRWQRQFFPMGCFKSHLITKI